MSEHNKNFYSLKEVERCLEASKEFQDGEEIYYFIGALRYVYDENKQLKSQLQQKENIIKELKKTELKYDALLVIQENTQHRIEKQDERIKELKEEIVENEKQIKLLQSKQFDIKANAEQKLKEKDKEIKELKKQIKKLTPKEVK